MCTRSLFITTVIIALVVGLTGCGGGGGGGGGLGGYGSGTGAVPEPGQYIEFTRVSGGAAVDPYNLKVGDVVKMVLANYNLLGDREELFTGSWSSSVGASFIALDSASGQFTVVASPGIYFQFQTTSVIGGSNTLFSQAARVPIATPTVIGRVVDLNNFSGSPSDVGSPHIQVEFFNLAGTRVGSARTDAKGWFIASVPTSAIRMMVLSGSIPTSKYFRSVYYQNSVFSPLDPSCRISIGPLFNGSNSVPAAMALPQTAGSIPPPPTGCS